MFNYVLFLFLLNLVIYFVVKFQTNVFLNLFKSTLSEALIFLNGKFATTFNTYNMFMFYEYYNTCMKNHQQVFRINHPHDTTLNTHIKNYHT